MHKLLLTLGITAALAACNKSDHTIVAGQDPGDETNTAAIDANVVLPPAIKASKTYRCADNRIVKIDWLEGGKEATVTPDKGTPIAVATSEAGKPMTAADGTSVSGSDSAASVKIGIGGKPAQSCNA